MEPVEKDKEQLLDCLKALSVLDGAVRYIHGTLKEDARVYKEIDFLYTTLLTWYEGSK